MARMARTARSSKRTAVETSPRVRNSYDAAAQTARTSRWQAPTVSPNQLLYNLSTLRDRSRAAVRNDGHAKAIIDALVTNLIGTGIKPMSQAADPDFRRQLQALWLRWTDESDADGLLDFYGQQGQATRAWLEGGEAFVRQRLRRVEDGLSVPLQLQVLEPELCPHTLTMSLPSGAKVRAGIEFDAIGRRAAYWFHPTRPGDLQDFDASQLRRVPGETVTHLYDPLRPGQLRGLPHLTTTLVRLYDLDKLGDATLLRQQLANLFVAFITRPNAVDDEATTHPMTGQRAPTAAAGELPTLAKLEPGLTQELGEGEQMQFSNPPTVGPEFEVFMRTQLRAACAASGVPYELVTGDLTAVNDRSVRVLMNEFRRRLSAWQHQIIVFQFCRPVWQAFVDRVFLSGAIAMPMSYLTNPEPWTRVIWVPQGWPYINPVQDVQAKKDAVRGGFSSRSAEVSETGEDAEAIDAQQAVDNERADRLKLAYDSDGRKAASSSLSISQTPNTANAPEETGATS
jgi:lambda family phage portal protein